MLLAIESLVRSLSTVGIDRQWWLSSVRFNYKPGYRPCDLFLINCSHWLKLQHSAWRANLVKKILDRINFPP